MSLTLKWFLVTLANGAEHKVFATDENAARVLVLFDTDLVPANLRGQFPTVAPWVEPIKAPVVIPAGTFKMGDSMVNINGRTFVKRG